MTWSPSTAPLAVALLACAPSLVAASTVGDCHVGAYRLDDGTLVSVDPTDGAALRWRRFDGTTGALHPAADGSWSSTLGWTDRADGVTVAFSGCARGEIRFDGKRGRRVTFDVKETTFQGRDVTLAGRLVLPRGGGRVPIAVLVHGSENTSARDFYALQRLLPAQGVGVFVYDKRGTGASGGAYSQDFDLLADDAAAAVREARRLAGARAGRVGLQGGSQGGWVAPLAATRTKVDFVIVSFGLAVSPIEEDLEEVELEMSLKGHGRDVIARALEVARAAEKVMTSGFTEGFAEFDAVRARYRGEPWYKDLRGNLTRFLLPYDEAELRERGKGFRWGTPWHYDSMPVLRAVEAPQLWILGEDDLDAPCAETSRRIQALIRDGRRITLATFPHSEHGIAEYELGPGGERVTTRISEGYYAMMRDFIRDGALGPRYGRSSIVRPSGAR